MTANSRGVVRADAAAKQRLDKWLCYARLVKTRKQAVRLISDGHVRIDARRIEVAAKSVGAGDVLTIALERQVRVLRVVAIAARRGSSRSSRLLFEDLMAVDVGESSP